MKNYDVVIIGAGLSGIGMACEIKQKCPNKKIALFEKRKNMGGTWDLFRYPGIRSDSDMVTMCYDFKPWDSEQVTARGDQILSYIKEASSEYHINELISYEHSLVRSDWNSSKGQWELTFDTPTGKSVITTQFLSLCTGYYKYDKGYSPNFKNKELFQGQIIHAQHWPENFDYSNKKVIVIGSGATASTLVPAMAEKAQHVTMLQRSPSYYFVFPNLDPVAKIAYRFFNKERAYKIVWLKNVWLQKIVYILARKFPKFMKSLLLLPLRFALGSKQIVKDNFNPHYKPWDQRLCLIPDGDLFEAIKNEKACVVTDHIDHFTNNGIRLKSGKHLKADLIVLATGLNVAFAEGVSLYKDGQPIDITSCYTYKGMMLSGVPNLVHVFGYINATWGLRLNLVTRWTARLLNFMDRNKTNICTPSMTELERQPGALPFITGFNSNYIQRAINKLPKQAHSWPWQNIQNYTLERKLIDREQIISDGHLQFTQRQLTTKRPTKAQLDLEL